MASMIQPRPMPEVLEKKRDQRTSTLKGQNYHQRTSLPKVSDKMRARLVDYRIAKSNWWVARLKLDKGRCQFVENGDRCHKQACQSPHHIYGRGKYLCETGGFFAACFEHHNWIHDNPKEAEARGYLVRDRGLGKQEAST